MMKGISTKEKNIILISGLAVLLLSLILVYIFLIAPLLEEEIVDTKPPEIVDGEGLYLDTMVTIYPEIAVNDVTYIEISNDTGTYAFHKYYDSTFEKEEMRIKGYERIEFDQSTFATLLAYTRLPVSYQSNEEKNAPMRNLSQEDMEKYGLTEDTCTAKYKIGYRDSDGVEKFYSVFIGYPTFTDYTTYYVALEGRNTAYRFHNEGVSGALLVSLESYLTPLVYDRFSTSLNAMASVDHFKIGITDPLADPSSKDYIRTVIEVKSKGLNEDGTAKNYELIYQSLGTGNVLRIPASSDMLTKAFETLFVSFEGESVVCIEPTQEQLNECGLGLDFKNYYISVQLSDDPEDTYSFQLSEEKDGYFYTLSNLYGEDNQMLVKVPKETLSFLSTEDETVYSWADTSVTTLFYEYLVRDDEKGEPGMHTVTVRAQKSGNNGYDVSESFIITDDGLGHINATAKSNGKVYSTTYTSSGYAINQFTNFYQLLIYFPKPNSFNNLTYEEIDALKNDDSAIVFELVTRDNGNNLLKYTYYQIDKGVKVMVEETKGALVNGEEVWEEGAIHFNVSLSQMDILRENFQKLLNGEEITPEDYTH